MMPRRAGREAGRSTTVSDQPLPVVILATPDAQPLDVVGPHEVLALARRKVHELGAGGRPGYGVEVVTMGRSARIIGASGLSIAASGSFYNAPAQIDTLLVVGGIQPPPAGAYRQAVDWLRRQAPRVRRIAGICTGGFLLADAGLLDGRHATTHWYFQEEFARRYPAVLADPDPLFVQDGNIYTCAGVTSAIDLALALVEEDFGTDVAARIARAYVLFLRRAGGQSQFAAPLAFASSSRSPLNRLQLWLLDNLHEPITVERMAAFASMSPRHLARVFRREFRSPPGEYLQMLRIEAARKRLEDTTDTIAHIAATTGFGTASTLRRAFLARLDIAPSTYRIRFRRPLGARRRSARLNQMKAPLVVVTR